MSENIKTIIVGKYKYIFSVPEFDDAQKIFSSDLNNVNKIASVAAKYIYVKEKDASDALEGKRIDQVFNDQKDAVRSLAAVTTWVKWISKMQSADEAEAEEWEKALGED